MKLTLPSLRYQQSYAEYIEELGDEERYPFPLDFEYQNFSALLKKLDDLTRGVNLPENGVPSSTRWLTDGDQLIGVTNLRHFLNRTIVHCGGHIGLGIRPGFRGKGLGNLLMKLSIDKLQQRGVKVIHLHCYKDNAASAAMIVANGGILDSEVSVDGKLVQRYLVRKTDQRGAVSQ